MNLNDYLDPVDIKFANKDFINSKEQLFSSVSVHTPEKKIKAIENYNVAIIGVPGNLPENIDESINGLLKIREYLYSLSSFNKQIKIYDLGNLKQGNTANDHSVGLRDVIVELVTSNITPIIIGSSEDIIYPNYLAYQKLDKKINMVSIDSKIKIVEDRESEYRSALWKIIVENNESLFFFSNIGYQTHFVNSKITKYLSDQLHFFYRLGYIRCKHY